MRRVLLIAYHFPPYRGSSGLLRTLKFAQHLGRYGWQPTVITADPRAYERRYEGIPDPPAGVEVHRPFAFDIGRHLTIAGHYPRFLALPDRWAPWWFAGVKRTVALARRLKPDIIWSTYPIATAHAIGMSAHRRTGIPWVADCRDSMTEADYPREALKRRVFRWIERRMVTEASRVVFTAPGTAKMYAERYPEVPASRWALLPNGYDEEDFAPLGEARPASNGGPLKLLHSGVLYPIERDPRALFTALRSLLDKKAIDGSRLQVVLRASNHDRELTELIEQYQVGELVRLERGVPYAEALAEMMSTDALLLLQGASCNHQIPAKLYEYMRTGQPILALTDRTGDTGRQILDSHAGIVCPLDDAEAIERELPRFLDAVRTRSAPATDRTEARVFDRANQAGELAKLFEEVLAQKGGAK
jgi:glycosyltransferase involved in cell wall biosynthesis